MVINAQKWLLDKPKYNSIKKRKDIVTLIIGSKELEEELDLKDFIKLRTLYCDNNKLTKLDLSNCRKIKEIYCQKNHLESLILPDNSKVTHLNISSNLLSGEDIFEKLSNELIYLDIRDNKFSQKSLSFLSRFTELEVLKLGRKRFDASFAFKTMLSHDNRHLNSFGGSLEYLQSMYKLEKLSIINTDISINIDAGKKLNVREQLEHLPSSLKKINCGTTSGRELAYKCRRICKELEIVKNCDLGNNEYDLDVWRKSNKSPPSSRSSYEEVRSITSSSSGTIVPGQEASSDEEAIQEQMNKKTKELLNEINTMLNTIKKVNNELQNEIKNLKQENERLKAVKEMKSKEFDSLMKELKIKISGLKTIELFLDKKSKEISETLGATENVSSLSLSEGKKLSDGEKDDIKNEISEYDTHKKEIEEIREIVEKLTKEVVAVEQEAKDNEVVAQEVEPPKSPNE